MPASSPASILKQWFGYPSFRPQQEEIITAITGGRDVLAVIATGGGKSVCYQIPAMIREGMGIVVSPLIALMKDQVDGLKEAGIPAAYLNSTLGYAEKKEIDAAIRSGTLRILYLSPERLVQPSFLSSIASIPISLVAIDEAHCISQWGHEFRPEYRQLSVIRRELPDVPIIALTATATPSVRSDIITELSLRDPAVFIGSFNRANLFYRIEEKKTPEIQVIDFLDRHRDESGIIYCFSKKQVEDLAALLRQNGFDAHPYHADLPPARRNDVQEKFLRDEVRIIVATVAFGMGINKPDVRYVIHYDLPKNIEHYYQETGRAGRDGDPAECLLLYSRKDFRKIEYLIEQMGDGIERQVALRKLHDIIGFCETKACRRTVLLNYFGEPYDEPSCNGCDACETGRKTIDGRGVLTMITRCLDEIEERFGVSYVADILSGTADEKVRRNGHDRIASFGAGKQYRRAQWIFWIRELVFCGFLTSHGNRYPTVRKNARTTSALSGSIPVRIAEPEFQATLGQVQEEAADEADISNLYEILRDVRKIIADEEDVPPFQIFPNRTLKEMAKQMPRTLPELLVVYGVGEHKLKRYGLQFLEAITGYTDRERV